MWRDFDFPYYAGQPVKVTKSSEFRGDRCSAESGSSQFQGIGVSVGRDKTGTGTVRVVSNLSEASRVKAGDILVTHRTTPGRCS